MAVKMLFLISPLYSDPPMSTRRRPKSSRMNVWLLVPSSSGSAFKRGMSMTVNSGTWLRNFSGSNSRMNMLRANRLCQAYSVMMRTGMR